MKACKDLYGAKASEASINSMWSYRYDSLLLLLTDIKSISMRFMHYLIMFHTKHKIRLPTLFYDMYETQNVFGLTSKGFLLTQSDTLMMMAPIDESSNKDTHMKDAYDDDDNDDEDDLNEDDEVDDKDEPEDNDENTSLMTEDNYRNAQNQFEFENNTEPTNHNNNTQSQHQDIDEINSGLNASISNN